MKMHVIIESRGQGPWTLPWISAQRWGMGIWTLGEEAKCIGLRAATQLPHLETFLVFMHEAISAERQHLNTVPDKTSDLRKWLFSFS